MMKMKQYILWCFALPSLMACQGEEPLVSVSPDAFVTLSANIDQQADTRAPYTLTTPGTGGDALATRIWASTTSHSYANTGAKGTEGDSHTVATHFDLTFNANSVQVPEATIVYPYITAENTPRVYFVGFYPNSGWSEASSTSSTYSGIDGKTDVMYAPEVNGVYATATPPQLHFYHLLTYLDIKLYAESAEARDAWGDITSMTISSLPNIQVNLSSSPTITDNTILSTVTTGGSATTMRFYNTDDTAFSPNVGSPFTLPTTVGTAKNLYILCAPVNAASSITDYSVTIETVRRGSVVVPINLKSAADTEYAASTMGKKFTVSIVFGFGNTIAVAGQLVNDWTNAGYGKATLEE